MANVDIPEFPKNSKSITPRENRSDDPETKKLDKVVTGSVVEDKPSWFRTMLIGDDPRRVGQVIFTDVVLPAIRSMVVDAVKAGTERLIYGDSGGHRSRAGTPRVSYSEYSRRSGYATTTNYTPRGPRVESDTHGTYIFASGEDAVTALSTINEVIEEYGSASVSDWNDVVGVSSTISDRRWGWTEPIITKLHETRQGVKVTLPTTRSIR